MGKFWISPQRPSFRISSSVDYSSIHLWYGALNLEGCRRFKRVLADATTILKLTAFMAGAGVQAPYSHGATDPFGYQATEKVVTTHDFHATLLHLVGLDHRRLSVYHNGIERRLTNVHGTVIRELLES